MKPTAYHGNVINFMDILAERNASRLVAQEQLPVSHTQVLAVTSGKGGVGKTSVVVNLAVALSRLDKKVMIFDADLGLGNLDIMLGLTPQYNLAHVISGQKTLEEVMVAGPRGVRIIPAASGIQEMTRLTRRQIVQVLSALDLMMDPVDILLIDTAAGISTNVMYFNSIAQEVIVVVTPEPTSITDAYALMKILSLKYAIFDFRLLINLAASPQEADEVFRQLKLVTDRFLNISISYLGHVLRDMSISKSVRQQKVAYELFPQAPASICFKKLAGQLADDLKAFQNGQRNGGLAWESLMRCELP